MEYFTPTLKRFGFVRGFEDTLRAQGILDTEPMHDYDFIQACEQEPFARPSPNYVPTDPSEIPTFVKALEKLLKTSMVRARLERRIAKLETDMKLLLVASKRQDLQADCLPISQSLTIPITTLAPEPYELIHPIYILIQHSNDSFTASFLDANVNASGDTEAEAMEEVKIAILDMFDRLESIHDSKLGPGPRKQKKVLQSVIKRKG